MAYPSTIQHLETISNSNGLFSSLRGVSLVGDSYCSCNFGTVFKIITDGGTMALKCFTRAQHGRLAAYQQIAKSIPSSRYIIDYKYGYINQRGRWWEQSICDYAQSFRDGRAAMELKGREFFITYKR